jgi:solute carrier family 13 (sodium-dependent dicarboxylate transporter), member 2/3/5
MKPGVKEAKLRPRQIVALLAGPLLFLVVLAVPYGDGLSPEARRVAAVAVWMAVWWIGEAIPIPATALLPLALFPMLGALPAREVALNYGDRNIFLFAGGFFIAMAMQKWGLHERLALQIIRRSGSSDRRLILGFMAATAFLSMWISNTATAMMLTPIGAAVIEQIITRRGEGARQLAPALMLGIAYAASVGGIATLVGTPPNIVFVSQMDALFPDAPPITFLRWLAIGLPFALIFLPIIWFLLTRVLFTISAENRENSLAEAIVTERLAALGPMSRGERVVSIVASLTAICWITRFAWSDLFPQAEYIDDSTVAIFFALVLFVIPIDRERGEFALDWEWAQRIPWGILLLFGGGLALAAGCRESGLITWVGIRMEVLAPLPLPLIILGVALLVTLLTELTSNVATTTILLPVLAVTATTGLDINPLILMVPATISASCAFMLPVATPPNAIVFHGGYLDIPTMARTGVALNLIAALLITLLTYWMLPAAFGFAGASLPAWAENFDLIRPQ